MPTPPSNLLVNIGDTMTAALWNNAMTEIYNAITTSVYTINGRSGNVVMTLADIPGAAPAANAVLSGTTVFAGPAFAQTPPARDASSNVATTGYVVNTCVLANTTSIALNGTNPALNLTGTNPVIHLSGAAPLVQLTSNGVAGAQINLIGSPSSISALANSVYQWTLNLSDSNSNFSIFNFSNSGSPLGIPLSINRTSGVVAFGSTPTAPSPPAADLSANVATTAWVNAQGYTSGLGGGVTSFQGRTGAVSLSQSDVVGSLGFYPVNSGNQYSVTGDAFGTGQYGGTLNLVLATTGVVASTYGSASSVASLTIDLKGRIINAVSIPFSGDVSSVNGYVGNVSLAYSDVGAAPINNPNFTGTVWAPSLTTITQIPNDISDNVATTAFVFNAINGGFGASPDGDVFSNDVFISEASPTLWLQKGPTVNSIGTVASIVGQANSVNRWQINLGDYTPELGANSGSNFSICSNDDNGDLFVPVMNIDRSNGTTSFYNALTAPTPANGDISSNVATTQFVAYAVGSAPYLTSIGGGLISDGNLGIIPYGAETSMTLFSAPYGITTAAIDIYSPLDSGLILHTQGGPTTNRYIGAGNNVPGVNRVQLFVADNASESGNSTGSNFKIIMYDDSGNYLNTPLHIYRSNSVVNFANSVYVNAPVYGAGFVETGAVVYNITSNTVITLANTITSAMFMSNATSGSDYNLSVTLPTPPITSGKATLNLYFPYSYAGTLNTSFYPPSGASVDYSSMTQLSGLTAFTSTGCVNITGYLNFVWFAGVNTWYLTNQPILIS